MRADLLSLSFSLPLPVGPGGNAEVEEETKVEACVSEASARRALELTLGLPAVPDFELSVVGVE